MSCIFIINKGIFPYTISFIGDKMTYDKTIGYDDFDIQNEVQKLQMLFILQKFTFFFELNGIISLKQDNNQITIEFLTCSQNHFPHSQDVFQHKHYK